MASNMLTLKWESHKISYIKVLSQIRQSAAFSDATIACDGKFYNVHKLVMSSCSDYLKTLFENVDMCGSQIAHPVIILHGVTHQHMEALLDYVYLGKVNILQTELASLVKAAEILQIKGLAIPNTCSFLGSNENKRSREENILKDIEKTDLMLKKYKNITNRFEKVKDEQDSFKFKHQIKGLAIPDTCSFSGSNENKRSREEKILKDIEKTDLMIKKSKNITNRFEKVEDEQDSFKFKHQIECFKSDIENQGEEKEASSPINENISHPDNHSIISEQENSSSSKYHEQENNCDSAEPHSSNVDSNIQYDENMNNKTPPKHDDGESNFSPGGPIEAIDLWLQLKSYKGRTDGVNCPLCTKRCFNKGAFLTHYKTHTGDKPYACPHCPRRFVQRVSQRNHIKTHTAARQFECSLCSRRFIQKNNLKNHIASHSRKKVLIYKEMGNL